MVKEGLKLFRKRYIPDELIELKDDRIIYLDDNYLITEWKPLNPREDFSGGKSLYCFNDGYKISKIFGKNGNVIHWYCDICEFERNESENTIVARDMLFDVIILPDGHEMILDADEAAEALERGLITQEQLAGALRSMDSLLKTIRSGDVKKLMARL